MPRYLPPPPGARPRHGAAARGDGASRCDPGHRRPPHAQDAPGQALRGPRLSDWRRGGERAGLALHNPLALTGLRTWHARARSAPRVAGRAERASWPAQRENLGV
eukprot:scaffold16771_cov58-Phaeocystis_antarctica.AAC.1